MSDDPHTRRPALRRAAFRCLAIGLVFVGWLLFVSDDSPLDNAWNPFVPLDVGDHFTTLSKWKLSRALGDRERCLAALETGATMQVQPDHVESEVCHIRPQVSVSQVGMSRITPLNTRCQTALRMAMWERHGIQPAARRHLGGQVRQINHLSSYNCRQMRTTGSGAPRMSTHATANAIDIAGFVMEGGQEVSLLKNWNAPAPQAAFLKDVRDSACEWFRVTLGPDYNRLHADHFHLQHTGWGLCR